MAPKAKSGDISRNSDKEMSAPENSPFRRMLNDMSAVAQAEAESATFMGDALAAIYGAESEDDIWDSDMSGPLNAQHLGGCELTLYELRVFFSRGRDGDEITTPWVSADGKKMYILVTAARISDAGRKKFIKLPDVGEQFQFNTSAQFLTAKLFTFWTRGYFGSGKTMNAAIQSTDLGDGKAVLKLVRVPERVVQAKAEPYDDHYEEDASVVNEGVPAGEPPF